MKQRKLNTRKDKISFLKDLVAGTAALTQLKSELSEVDVVRFEQEEQSKLTPAEIDRADAIVLRLMHAGIPDDKMIDALTEEEHIILEGVHNALKTRPAGYAQAKADNERR